MPFDLGSFSLIDMLQCGRGVRRVAGNSASLGEAANSVVEYLYQECTGGGAADPHCALIRFYKTMPFAELSSDLQNFAKSKLSGLSAPPEMKCLTLLASIGEEPDWCDPALSHDHRAVPLPSSEIVSQAPMIAQLISEMGLDVTDILAPDPGFIEERAGKTYNVFHVTDALGSPYIPAQSDFVVPYGVKSVVGFGGMLADGDLFAVIMFARTTIPPESASRFRNIALDLKAAIYAFAPPRSRI